jgi:hypothetical protein
MLAKAPHRKRAPAYLEASGAVPIMNKADGALGSAITTTRKITGIVAAQWRIAEQEATPVARGAPRLTGAAPDLVPPVVRSAAPAGCLDAGRYCNLARVGRRRQTRRNGRGDATQRASFRNSTCDINEAVQRRSQSLGFMNWSRCCNPASRSAASSTKCSGDKSGNPTTSGIRPSPLSPPLLVRKILPGCCPGHFRASNRFVRTGFDQMTSERAKGNPSRFALPISGFLASTQSSKLSRRSGWFFEIQCLHA